MLPNKPQLPILATDNQRQWQVRRLNDDTLQISLGDVSLFVTLTEFRAIAQLIAAGQTAAVRSERIAAPGLQWAVFRCPNHGTIGFRVDRTLVRSGPPDFAALDRLCQQPSAQLGPALPAVGLPLTARIEIGLN